MNTEPPCLDLEYMEIDEDDRLTERDALMLGLRHDLDEEGFSIDSKG